MPNPLQAALVNQIHSLVLLDPEHRQIRHPGWSVITI